MLVKNLAEQGLIVIGQRQKRSNPLYQQLQQATSNRQISTSWSLAIFRSDRR